MPPRRRQSPPPDQDHQEPPSPGNNSDTTQSLEEEEEEHDDDDAIQVPFYNTTFSAHRVSPLHLGAEPLTAPRLRLLAQRLRDRLVGDVVRGVEVGSVEVDGRAGALESVEMRWVGVADVLGVSREQLEEEAEEGTAEKVTLRPGSKALHVALRYEMASCTALLLPPLEEPRRRGVDAAAAAFSVGAAALQQQQQQSVDASSSSRFLALPLLLLRMPAPLKTVVSDFLATTFDCRVSPMRLGTRSLVHSWEAWIRSAGLPSRGPLAKDVVLTLGFYVPPPNRLSAAPEQRSGEDEGAEADQPLGLRSIDVIIPAAELRKFVAAGKRLPQPQDKQPASTTPGWEHDDKQRRRLAGRLYEEGWEWRAAPDAAARQPFTEALACYLQEHLALNLFHPGVRVTKVACAGFVMSETRLKVFAPGGSADGAEVGWRRAVLELLAALVDKAQVQMIAA
ncbi:uncharacterized protein THITE_2144762 [Thermothielavioides terrestris NRRL 8126]|jgi:hypothetical protein|uniref:Siroheme synthase n=1 Tax=Thermothielavioides terrestris (strain ATCC 38088 / NRRL 8126) TaxID=578455 RepID=G2R182_THETT|nr:uncharacterized protein THITE_2144762 [Thermothielavioides terrestris NRRL 8126]AEO67372.1 hypothetical protein THITE_2144762 [Thermothielavioides terrestris NRRL 8126]